MERTGNDVELRALQGAQKEGAAVAESAAHTTGDNLDGVVSAEEIVADEACALAHPVGSCRVGLEVCSTCSRLQANVWLVLQVEADDHFMEVLPHLSGVLALVLKDAPETGIEEALGVLVRVEVVTKASVWVRWSLPDWVDTVGVVGRNDDLHSIAVLTNQIEGLVEEIEGLVVVHTKRFFEWRDRPCNSGSLLTPAVLVAHPETQNLDAIGSELLDMIDLVLSLEHALEEVAVRAGPGVDSGDRTGHNDNAEDG